MGRDAGIHEQLARLLKAEIADGADADELASMLLGEAGGAEEGKAGGAEEEKAGGEWDAGALRELGETGSVAAPSSLRYSSDSGSSRDFGSDGARDFDSDTLQGEAPDASPGRVLVYTAAGGAQWHGGLDVLASLEGERWFWLDVADANPDEVERVGRRFGLHPLTVEDIVGAAGERDRLERVGGYALLAFSTMAAGGSVEAFSLVLGARWALSFHGAAASHHVRRVAARLGSGDVRGLEQSALVAYAAVDEITDWLAHAVARVERDVARLDGAVLELLEQQGEPAAQVLQHVGLVRRRLLGLWRLARSKGDVVRQLARELRFGDEARHRFGDVNDHVAALSSVCAQCEMVLSRAHANYSGQLALRANRITHDVGVFSSRWLVLMGLMLPLQVATMAFGQNIRVPWKHSDEPLRFDSDAPWLGIMGAILLTFAACLALAWSRSYLSLGI
ncbi:hypothetical protein LPJ63_004579 [Coemansia sp. RSA 2711]|nr:hypothetical protein LPJ63_004579 [Coemansia sp. RSA 2711]